MNLRNLHLITNFKLFDRINTITKIIYLEIMLTLLNLILQPKYNPYLYDL